MSQNSNELSLVQKPEPSFWLRHFDLFGLAAFAFMAFSFLFYWTVKHSPHPDHELLLWGRMFLLPLSNFLLFLYLVLSQVLPPLTDHLYQRRLQLQRGFRIFEEQSNEIASRYHTIRENLAHVDEEVETLLAAARESAEKEKERLLARARRQAQRIEEDARATIVQERRHLMQSLQEKMIAEAWNQAEALLEQHLTSEDQRRLESEFLQAVEKIA